MVAKSGIDLQFSDYAIDFLAETASITVLSKAIESLIKEIVNQLSRKILAGISTNLRRCWLMF